MSSHISTHSHTHTHTHTHMHAHIVSRQGHRGATLPSSFGWGWGGVFAFVTHFSGEARELPWTGGGLRDFGGCSVLCFRCGFLLDLYGIGLTKCNFKLHVCHAMLCSAMVCCCVKRCKVTSCSVVCCGVLRLSIVCDLLWCAMLCGGLVCGGHMTCPVVCCFVMWCGWVSCGVLCCHVVWCFPVGNRAIGLPVWLVEWFVACVAGWVVWELGLFSWLFG